MDHFGGLDVSVKETSICIMDDTGRIVKEVKVASEHEALLKVWVNLPTAPSGSDWKPDRYRNGCSGLLPKLSYRFDLSSIGKIGTGVQRVPRDHLL